MHQEKFYSLVSDTTFKYLFKNDKTRFFFNELIKYYTDINISNFHLIDNELSSGNNYVSYRLDSILTNDDQSIILNIEMNKSYYKYLEYRNRKYLHTIAGYSKSTSSYKKKVIVIQLNFNNFNSTNNRCISKETYKLHDIKNNIILDDFIIHNIFIPTETSTCYNESVRKKLQLFLCNSFKELNDVVKDDRELKVVMSELERLNKDKYFGALYDAEEEQKKLELSAREEGYEEGHDIGLQEGVTESTRQIAIKMLDNDYSLEEISKITNLSIEDIKKLK